MYLSSFWSIYNSLFRSDPSSLIELSKKWKWEKPNRDPDGDKLVSYRPLVAFESGRPQINYARGFIALDSKTSSKDQMASAAKIRALKALRDSAWEHGFQLDTQSGDILLINNLSIMHARSAFSEDAAESVSRHVMRLWLKDETSSWPIAEDFGYLNQEEYKTRAEDQTLYTVGEWESMPRSGRLQKVGILLSHD